MDAVVAGAAETKIALDGMSPKQRRGIEETKAAPGKQEKEKVQPNKKLAPISF